MLFAKALVGVVSLIAASVAPCAAFNNHTITPTIESRSTEEAEESLFNQDFEGAISEDYGSNFTIENGKGIVNTQEQFTIPFTGVTSNNYEIDFDVAFNGNSSSNIFIHLVGLDNNEGNIYLGIEGNGAYWNFRSQRNPSGEVYNNSGDFFGGLDYNAVDLVAGAHVKIVHFNGYIECYVNGTRRFVAHLNQFGGTQYQGYNRLNINPGKITAIGIHTPDNANAVAFDNIKITEAKLRSDVIYQTNPNGERYSIVKPTAQDLDYDNLQVSTVIRTNDITKTGTFPVVKLVGLNGELFGHNIESSLNCQFYDDNNYLTPAMYSQKADGSGWNETSGAAFSNEVGDTFVFTIEVIGDSIKAYKDDTLLYETSFTNLGITKGHLQYIMVRPGESGYSWTDFIYKGYTETAGATVITPKTVYSAGSEITASAYHFGDRTQAYTWYVDGVDTGISTTTYSEVLSAGTHTLEYKNATYTSNVVTVEVTEGIITIAAEDASGYTTSTFTVNATYEGDFTGLTTEWYVDNEKIAATGDSVEISGLEIGNHTVYAIAGTVKSNTITLTVNEPKLTITSEKSAYSRQDTAKVSAKAYGLGEDITYKWYLNGTVVEGQTGAELLVDMSQYNDGAQIIVKCAVGELISNEFYLTIYYDIAAKLMADETYEVLNEVVIEEGGDFNNFLVGHDDDGNYLYADPQTTGPNFLIKGNLPKKNAYTYEYKLYVPSDLPAEYYVYPCLIGANSKYPTASIEVAFAINENGMRPYIKDQGSNTNYDDASGSVIADYSFETGCAIKGNWNHVIFSVENKSVAVSLNNTPVLFFTLPSITVPTGLSMNWWSSADGKNIPLKVKDIKTGGLVEPPSPLESISLSLSATECKVNETITINAVINPFDAVVESFDWYINDELQSTHTKTLTFTPTTTGTYEIYCRVGDIVSAKKTVTVISDAPASSKKGCGGSIAATSIALSALALAAGGLMLYSKKRKEK